MMGPEWRVPLVSRRLGAAIATTTVSVGAFGLLFAFTTQVEAIRAVVSFTEDPYDAVSSVAIILLVCIAPPTGLRVVRLARDRVADEATRGALARRMLIGLGLALGLVTTSLAADVVAMAAIPGTPLPVTFGVAGTGLATTVAWVAWWRARACLTATAPGDEPDSIDDLLALGGLERPPVAALGRWLAGSRLNPRRNRALAGTVVALGAALAGVAWHAVREGAWASPAAALVYGSLVAAAVVVGYVIVVWPLHGLRQTS